jgi:hypothetical protein
VSAVGSDAGEERHASELSFPAATAVMIPERRNDATAAFIAEDRLLPRDMLATHLRVRGKVQFCITLSRPARTALHEPEPRSFSTLTLHTRAFLATP